MEQKINSDNLELLIIKMALTNEEYLKNYGSYLATNNYKTKSYFEDQKHQLILNIANVFYQKFLKLPKEKEIASIIDRIDEEKEIKVLVYSFLSNIYADKTEYNTDYIKAETEKFIKRTRFLEGLLLNQDNIEKGDLDKVAENLSEIIDLNISNIDKPLVISNTFDKEQLESMFEEEAKTKKIKSLYPGLDEVLNGGFRGGKMYGFAGIAGGGKSIMLLQFGINAIKRNNKVLFLSMEMDKRTMLNRININILPDTYSNTEEMNISYSTNKEMLFTDLELSYKELTGKMDIVCPSSLGFTASNIEAYLSKEKYDMLIIDYLGIMDTNDGTNEENAHFKFKEITEQLRSIAKKYDIPVLTATQLNKEAYSKTTLSQANMAYSMGIAHTMDFMAGISPDGDELQVLKNRDGVATKLYLKMNKAKYKVVSIENRNDLKSIERR